MPDDSQPPQDEFPSLDAVQQQLQTTGADPLKSAEVIRNWRNEAATQLDQHFTDPTERNRAADKLDESVTSALKQQQGAAIDDWAKVRFNGDTQAAQDFLSSYDAARGDPQKLPDQYKGLATEADKIATASQFKPTYEGRNYTGSIMAGPVKIGAFSTRDLTHSGETEAQVTPITPGESQPDLSAKIAVRVPTPTADDLKAEADKATKEADRLDNEIQNLQASDYAVSTRELDQKAQEQRNKAKALLGPGGKDLLTGERIREKLKDPQYRDQIGQYAGGEEFANGVRNAIFSAGALKARAQDLWQGGEKNLQGIVEAQQAASEAYPGSTRRTLEGGFANEQIQAGQRMAGEMFPYAATAGVARGGLALAEKAGSSLAATELATQAANASGVGSMGAGMGVGAAGSSYADTQRQIDEATASGDTARADELRRGRDAHAVLTGLVMGGFSKLSPIHNFRASGNTAASWAKDIIGQTAEMPLMTATQGAIVDPLTIGNHPDVISEIPGAAVQGGAMALLMGGVTRIGQRMFGGNQQIEANRQKAHDLAANSGAADPETQQNIDLIHDQQKRLNEQQAKADAQAHIDSFKFTAEQLKFHNEAVDNIRSAATEGKLPTEPAPPPEATKEEKQLYDIREKEAAFRANEIQLMDVERDPNLSEEERKVLRDPLIKARTSQGVELLKLRKSLPDLHLSLETGPTGDQARAATSDSQTNDEKSKVQDQNQNDRPQGQESGGGRQEGQNEDAVTVRPATAGAPGEPLPPTEGSSNASPPATPQSQPEQSPQPSPAPASGQTQSAPSSDQPTIRQPWVNNALALAKQGKDQRGPLANALKAMTPEERASAAEQAGVKNPTLDDHILLAREMSQSASKKAPAEAPPPPGEPPKPQVAETPWGPDQTTGIKNEVIDNERAAMGMEPMAAAGRRAWGDLWDHATETLRNNAQAGYELVQRMLDPTGFWNAVGGAIMGGKHETLSDYEAALLLRHKIELEHRSQLAARAINDPRTTPEDLAAAVETRSAMQKALVDVHEVLRKAGTEAGRSLAARKMLMDRNEVPTLAEMEADRKIAKGGDLTPNEQNELAQVHHEMTVEKTKVDTQEEANSKAQASHEMQAVAEDLAKQTEPDAPAPEKSQKVKDKEAAREQRRKAGEEALQRLREKGFFGRTNMGLGVGPDELHDMAVYGHYVIGEGISKIADFTKHMVEKFGEIITKDIPAIFKAANSMSLDADQAIAKASKKAQKLKGLSPQGVMDARHEQVKAGDAVDPKIARELLEAHIRAGVKGVDDLTGRLKDDLTELYKRPIGDRDVWDAITGYGKVSKPSQDAVKKQAAEYRSQMLLTRKLDAALKREAILKTGPQRERASEEVRRLQRELNAEMRRSGYNATAEGQVRGRLDSIKQGLKNQIEDLESVLAGRQKIKPKGLPVETDPETEALKGRLAELRDHLRNVPEIKDQLDAAENVRAVAAAKASRDEYTRRIREKEFEARGKKDAKVSAELRTMRAERDLASKNYRDAKKTSDVGKAADLAKKVEAATAAVDKKTQELIDNNWTAKQKKGSKLSDNPELKLLQERRIELDNELRDQRYGDGMDALKQWYEKRKLDLQNALAGMEAAKPPGRIANDSPEAKSMREEIKGLERALREQKAPEAAMRSIEKRIADMREKIDTNDLSGPKKSSRVETPEMKSRQEYLDLLEQIHDKMLEADGTLANDRFRTRLEARTARMDEHQAAGFPKQAKKEPLKLDPASEAAQAKFAERKKAYETLKLKDELANRAGWEKGFDAAAGINRAFKLSRLMTDAKIILYSLFKLGAVPIQEATGAGVAKLMPELSNRANIEGGGSLASIGSFYRGFFGQGMKDAARAASPIAHILTRGRYGDIEAYSPLKAIHEDQPHLPPRWWDIPQITHEVLKSPLLRAGYEMSKTKIAENNARTGRSMTQAEINNLAYEQAKRGILMGDNRFASSINRGLKSLEEPHKVTKKEKFIYKGAATLFRFMLTFNKVASNHFVELFNTTAGAGVGVARAGAAQFRDAVAKRDWINSGSTNKQRVANLLAEGLQELHEDDANSIIRQIKTGSIGAAMLTFGMLAPHLFGGMNPHKKRKDGEPGFGEIEINGVRLPKVITMAAAPLLAAQIGATITQTADSKLRKHDKETQGIGMGLVAGALGVAESGPVVNEAAHFSDLMGENGREKWLGNWIKGNFIPGGLDEFAQAIDREAGVPVKRSAKGVWQQIQSALPVYREELPKAKVRR